MIDTDTQADLHSDEGTADLATVFNAMPLAVLIADAQTGVAYANPAAEELLDCSQSRFLKGGLHAALTEAGPLERLLDRSVRRNSPMSARDIGVELKSGQCLRLDVHVTALSEVPHQMVVILQRASGPDALTGHFTAKGVARSAYGVAAMLAHEIKNPLSGIRGAAQLLEDRAADSEDRELAGLIRSETDRIRGIIDRLDIFTDLRPIRCEPINIHEVLTHVRRVAEAGFGKGCQFREQFDPSLPKAFGNRELLIQMFLNLVKNACEAVSEPDGEITVISAFRPGLRVKSENGDDREILIDLPLMISVEDNGGGVPEALRDHLFDPFVSGREGRGGLGLAMVAKIVADHRGLIKYSGGAGRARFDVLLPAASERSVEGDHG